MVTVIELYSLNLEFVFFTSLKESRVFLRLILLTCSAYVRGLVPNLCPPDSLGTIKFQTIILKTILYGCKIVTVMPKTGGQDQVLIRGYLGTRGVSEEQKHTEPNDVYFCL